MKRETRFMCFTSFLLKEKLHMRLGVLFSYLFALFGLRLVVYVLVVKCSWQL